MDFSVLEVNNEVEISYALSYSLRLVPLNLYTPIVVKSKHIEILFFSITVLFKTRQ